MTLEQSSTLQPGGRFVSPVDPVPSVTHSTTNLWVALRPLQVETDHRGQPVSWGRGGEVSCQLSVLCSDGLWGSGIGAEVRLVLLGARTYS